MPAFDDFELLGRLPGLDTGPSRMDDYWDSDDSDYTPDSASCEDDDHELPPDLCKYGSSDDESKVDAEVNVMVEALPLRRRMGTPIHAPHLDIEPFVSSFDEVS